MEFKTSRCPGGTKTTYQLECTGYNESPVSGVFPDLFLGYTVIPMYPTRVE